MTTTAITITASPASARQIAPKAPAVPFSDTALVTIDGVLGVFDAIFAKAIASPALAAAAASSKSVGGLRLAPDMNDLGFQVGRAVLLLSQFVARVNGTPFADADLPISEYEIRTFDDIRTMLDFAKQMRRKADPVRVAERENATVQLVGTTAEWNLPLNKYARFYVIPRMFFHLDMAYAILRRNGVDIGTTDYIVHFGIASGDPEVVMTGGQYGAE